MIKEVNRQIQINEAGVQWRLKSNNSCVSFSPQNGVTTVANEIVTFNITYNSTSCFNEDLALFMELEKEGCIETFNFPKVDPCADLDLTIPSVTYDGDRVTLVANATGGSGEYTYSWTFAQQGSLDPQQVKVLSQVENTIVFDLNSYNTDTIVYTKVTDEVTGCVKYAPFVVAYDVYFKVRNVTITQPCAPAGVFIPYEDLLDPNNNVDASWPTFETILITNVDSVTQANGGVVLQIDEPGTSSFTFKVESTDGLESNVGLVTVNVGDCAEVPPFQFWIPGMIKRLSPEAQVGDKIIFPITPRVSTNIDLDWSTWQIMKQPVNGSITLLPDRTIEYEITTIDVSFNDGDTFEWRIEDVNGTSSNRVIDVVSHEKVAPPNLVDDDVCLICNQTTNVTVLSNDTGEINLGSLQIVGTNPNVISTLNQANQIVLTPNDAVSSATITYQAQNFNGDSSTADINATVICAGEATDIDLLCESSKSINLINLFTGVQGSYVITETTPIADGSIIDGDTYSEQGGAITNPSAEAAVDFSSTDPGTYRFTLTVNGAGNCTEQQVTQNVVVSLSQNAVITIDTITANNDGTIDVEFTATSTNGQFAIFVDSAAAVFAENIQYTLNTNTGVGTGTFSVYFRDPSNSTVTIRDTDLCGNFKFGQAAIDNVNPFYYLNDDFELVTP